MDMKAFVSALCEGLSDNELNELRSLTWDASIERVRGNAKNGKYTPLSTFEENAGIVEAIKEYKSRTGVSLHEAKVIVEYYRGHYR